MGKSLASEMYAELKQRYKIRGYLIYALVAVNLLLTFKVANKIKE